MTLDGLQILHVINHSDGEEEMRDGRVIGKGWLCHFDEKCYFDVHFDIQNVEDD